MREDEKVAIAKQADRSLKFSRKHLSNAIVFALAGYLVFLMSYNKGSHTSLRG